jgi:serine/threonine protein kinase
VLEDQQQRLVTWSGLKETERCLVLKECGDANDSDRAAAQELLDKCLQRDPLLRSSMGQVLELAFISGRAADMKALLDGQNSLLKKVDAVKATVDDTNEKVDSLSDQLQKAQVGLRAALLDCYYHFAWLSAHTLASHH